MDVTNSPIESCAKNIEISHTAAVSNDDNETVTKLNCDTKPSIPDINAEPDITAEPDIKKETLPTVSGKTKEESLSKFPLSKQLSVTNPASKIPGMKRMPNQLKLKNNTNSPRFSQSSTPASTSRLSLISKKSNSVNKAISKTSLAPTKCAVKSPTSQLLKSPETKTGSRSASNASRGSSLTSKNSNNNSNLRKITSTAGDQNSLETLEKKLINLQSEFLTKIENLKRTPVAGQLQQKEYRLISFVCNGECKLLVKEDHLRKLPQKLPENSVNGLKEKIRMFFDESLSKFNESLKEGSAELNESQHKEKLQEIQDFNSKAVFDFIDDLCKSYKDGPTNESQMVKMQKDLQEYKKSLKAAETKLADLSKKHEEELVAAKNELKSKNLEAISHKESQIKELQKKLKSAEKQNDILKSSLKTNEDEDLAERANLEENLKICQENINSMEIKLNTTEDMLNLERMELKSKCESIKKLELDLESMHLKLQEQIAKYKAENRTPELLREITELRSIIHNLEKDKFSMEKTNQQLLEETSSIDKLQTQLQEAEKRIGCLQQQLTASEKRSESKSECSKDIQLELAKLRQSEAEKRREIEKLKVELSKSVFNINQLEEQIQRDQQLLEVRSDLINSLQTNETNQRIHVEELFAQVGEKNTTINELNNELRSKSEEFDSLYGKINTKHLELLNREHTIKLLEESNERCQMLRVKQEEKIGRMEEDIAHLKQTIAIFQAGILSPNGQLLYAPIMPRNHEDCNENFYHYTNQRKRKRQIDINVKKYEA